MADLGAWALGLLDRYLGTETTAGGWDSPRRAEAYQAIRKALGGCRCPGLWRSGNGNGASAPRGQVPGEALQLFRRPLEEALQTAQRPARALRRWRLHRLLRHCPRDGLRARRSSGMVEGVVPATSREDPLLPDSDREHAALPRPNSGAQRDPWRLPRRPCLRAGPDALFPQSNLGGQAGEAAVSLGCSSPPRPSRGTGVPSERLRTEATSPWLTALPSFEAAVSSEALQPASAPGVGAAQHHAGGRPARALPRRRAVLRCERSRPPPSASRLVAPPPADFDGLSPWAGASARATVRQAAPVFADLVRDVRDLPFRYFLKQVARVKETNHPESDHPDLAADRGNIIHDAWSAFFRDVARKRGGPGPDEPGRAEDRNRLLAIADEECDRAYARGITGSELLWRVDRARIRRDLALFLETTRGACGNATATFLEAEHSFGNMDTWATSLVTPGRPAVGTRRRPERRIPRRSRPRRPHRRWPGSSSTTTRAAVRRLHAIDREWTGSTPANTSSCRFTRAPFGRPSAARTARFPRHYWFASEREGFKRVGYELTPDDEEPTRGHARRPRQDGRGGHVPAGAGPEPVRRPMPPRRPTATASSVPSTASARAATAGARGMSASPRRASRAYLALAEPPADAPTEAATPMTDRAPSTRPPATPSHGDRRDAVRGGRARAAARRMSW